MESRLWHLLQQVPAAERRRILETLSETQRLALERWALSGRHLPAAPLKKTSATKLHGRRAVGGRTGVPGICSHAHAGQIRYDARVSCWPFRLSCRMSSDLNVVLKQLELLNSVKRRFVALVQQCSWRCGQGSCAVRDFRWQCFTECLAEELCSRRVDVELDIGLRFEACVPSHFLLGKRLHTPCFPVTRTGLRLGHAAWRALYDAVAVGGVAGEGAKRRNRFTSLQRGMSQEDLQETWQKIRHVYSSVWSGAGQSRKRLAAQLSALERDFVKRSNARSPLELPRRNKEDAEQKICRLLQRWSKRKSGSKF